MGLNPSCNTVEGKRLPVLGDPPFTEELAEIAMKELREAIPQGLEFCNETRKVERYRPGSEGDKMQRMGIWTPGHEGDLETIEAITVKATAYGWTFHRNWYYWVCDGRQNPIPEAKARELNEKWGRQVRVDGFAGGQDVTGDVDHYHVDTFDGLLELVKLIQGQG